MCVSCGGGGVVVVRSAKPKKDSQLATRRTSCGFHSINTFIVNMLAYIATLLVVRDVIPNEESDSVPVQVRACHPHSDEIWSRLLAGSRDRGGALSGIIVGAGSCSLLISRLYKSFEVVERRSTGISNRLPTHQKSCLSKTLFAKLQKSRSIFTKSLQSINPLPANHSNNVCPTTPPHPRRRHQAANRQWQRRQAALQVHLFARRSDARL